MGWMNDGGESVTKLERDVEQCAPDIRKRYAPDA
jgi:hypothetical protein